MIGNLVKITRQYHLRNEEYYGVVVGYLSIDDGGPFKKTAKINLMLSSGKLWDFYMMSGDVLEVISEAG